MTPLLLQLAAALAISLDLPLLPRALVWIPALLWAPGVGFARRLDRGGSRLQMSLDATWLSLVLLLPALVVARLTQGGAWAVLGCSSLFTVLGMVVGWKHRSAQDGRLKGRVGVLFAALALSTWAAVSSPQLFRPLDAWWHAEGLEELSQDPVPWSPGVDWEVHEPIGWDQVGAARLRDDEGRGGVLDIQGSGTIALALRGQVGDSITVGDWTWTIEADPTVQADEGPVPRYLERGVVGLITTVEPGELQLVIRAAGPVDVYVFPSVDAPWEVDAAGDLKLVHYYQLLNIVENQRWAGEILDGERWLTINQPPLWSWVLAGASAGLDRDLPTANLLFLFVLFFLACSGLRLLELVAPSAPMAAWLLPGAFAVVHGRLMLEPGSTNFPDSLYAAALVGGLVALQQRGLWRFALIGLAAGALRYPGVIALSLAAVLSQVFTKESVLRHLAALWAAAVVVALALAAVALVSGNMAHWLDILWFETVPEHYSNNPEALELWKRPRRFFWIWLQYSGGALLLALPGMTRGARAVGATALVYSLLLCTIDHSPTHYFLPLVALSAVAVGANAAGLQGRWLRGLVPALALLGGLAFLFWGRLYG